MYTYIFDNRYRLYDDGTVQSVQTDRILKPYPLKKNGHTYIMAQIDHSLYPIARLVANNFIPNPNGYNCVHHKDGNMMNNAASNLFWSDTYENRTCRKLTREQMVDIRNVYQKGLGGKLAKQYGVSRQYINMVVKGERGV